MSIKLEQAEGCMSFLQTNAGVSEIFRLLITAVCVQGGCLYHFFKAEKFVVFELGGFRVQVVRLFGACCGGLLG